ncbi:hypothetical protein E2C01_067511 [Portunus trituberculatus]|uniref:Uncharacterized protein n=1 Tax=Portunus trituberculatus TaxID=210409 RepID=A0A5B7HPI5_PORTR|nr:hypothetical protein [Portunus trituberculatus]
MTRVSEDNPILLTLKVPTAPRRGSHATDLTCSRVYEQHGLIRRNLIDK